MNTTPRTFCYKVSYTIKQRESSTYPSALCKIFVQPQPSIAIAAILVRRSWHCIASWCCFCENIFGRRKPWFRTWPVREVNNLCLVQDPIRVPNFTFIQVTLVCLSPKFSRHNPVIVWYDHGITGVEIVDDFHVIKLA